MSVVALGPFVLLIDYRAKACLVRVDHEFLKAHLLFVTLQVLREPLIAHQIAHCAAFFRAKGQRVDFLLLFVEWLDPRSQIIGYKTVKLVRRREFAVNDDQWSVEISRTVNLELICEGITWESIAIALQEQYVQSDVVALRVLYFTVVFERYLLPKNTEERLLVGGHE